eukprot:996293_1
MISRFSKRSLCRWENTKCDLFFRRIRHARIFSSTPLPSDPSVSGWCASFCIRATLNLHKTKALLEKELGSDASTDYRFINKDNVLQIYSDSKDHKFYLFVFRFGAVVYWGCHLNSIHRLLDKIKAQHTVPLSEIPRSSIMSSLQTQVSQIYRRINPRYKDFDIDLDHGIPYNDTGHLYDYTVQSPNTESSRISLHNKFLRSGSTFADIFTDLGLPPSAAGPFSAEGLRPADLLLMDREDFRRLLPTIAQRLRLEEFVEEIKSSLDRSRQTQSNICDGQLDFAKRSMERHDRLVIPTFSRRIPALRVCSTSADSTSPIISRSAHSSSSSTAPTELVALSFALARSVRCRRDERALEKLDRALCRLMEARGGERHVGQVDMKFLQWSFRQRQQVGTTSLGGPEWEDPQFERWYSLLFDHLDIDARTEELLELYSADCDIVQRIKEERESRKSLGLEAWILLVILAEFMFVVVTW